MITKINDLLFPELSYKIVGVLFNVDNEMGYGYQEKYYQRAISEKLKQNNIKFTEQYCVNVNCAQNNVGRYFLDFLIEDKIILEIKKTHKFSKSYIDQTYAYLKTLNLKLGILANFTRNGVEYKRIVNLN